jgi:hypothetical protein
MPIGSLFVVLFITSLLALGCSNTSSGVDAALPGTYACADMTCAEGQICVTRIGPFGGQPTDVGPLPDAGTWGRCEARPSACGSQGDCTRSSCEPQCVEAICVPTPGYSTSELVVTDGGRRYVCMTSADSA